MSSSNCTRFTDNRMKGICDGCGLLASAHDPVAMAHRRPVTMAEEDPTGLDAHEPGAKLDAGKTQAWLCLAGFSRALAAVADVTTFGAKKYTRNGWATVHEGEERYMEAFGRHMLMFGAGYEVDEESQCLHKAQMIWNLLASLELELRRKNAGR